MSDTSAQFDLVSSQYGPGVLACWILSISSAFVSWTLHSEYRKHDSLDADLIVALAYPFIAACDVLSQIANYPQEFGSEADPELAQIQHRLALQAPLSVVTLFCTFAPWMILVSQRLTIHPMNILHVMGKANVPKLVVRKRALAVSVTWFICCVACAKRYYRGPHESYDDDHLKSLGIEAYEPFIISCWKLGQGKIFSSLFYHVVFLITYSFFLAQGIGLAYPFLISILAALFHCLDWNIERTAPIILLKRITETLRTVWGLIRTNMSSYIHTQIGGFHFLAAITLLEGRPDKFPIYNPFRLSGNSISELDQAFALFTGIVIFLFWCWGAYQSRNVPGAILKY
ncbi:hypothetical protein EDB80DRAFT_713694 [Ilyonectria destructans]|nr:hypothetical protein EDB80DRAFT_713694 [Ilyonectria destructans]